MERLSQELESLANDLEAYRDRLKEILISKRVECANINTLGELIESASILGRSTIFSIKNTPMDNEDLNLGGYYNHTKSLITGYNNTAGFSITGTAANNNMTSSLHCNFKMDFTNVNKLVWHCMKGANHGAMWVFISDGVNGSAAADSFISSCLGGLSVHYNNLPTSWTEYSINTTSITGVKTVTFMGGWKDATGYTTSNTRYSNIRLI